MQTTAEQKHQVFGFLKSGNGTPYQLEKAKIQIGRHKDADLLLKSGSVSAQHAVLEFFNNCAYLTDLNSMNGTLVNGVRLQQRTMIKTGDVIKFGLMATSFVFLLNEHVKSTKRKEDDLQSLTNLIKKQDTLGEDVQVAAPKQVVIEDEEFPVQQQQTVTQKIATNEDTAVEERLSKLERKL